LWRLCDGIAHDESVCVAVLSAFGLAHNGPPHVVAHIEPDHISLGLTERISLGTAHDLPICFSHLEPLGVAVFRALGLAHPEPVAGAHLESLRLALEVAVRFALEVADDQSECLALGSAVGVAFCQPDAWALGLPICFSHLEPLRLALD
jgi:hypothetical protein